jgi:GTP-binding protein LepA
MSTELTRNFSIIAHIDHGKTTLSDRLMESTLTVTMRESTAQQLDSMDLEREKGITIKAHPVAMEYTAKDGKTYKLNLLDTPGHVDFSYEVSRALAACEGAILMVDAAQGVEAQTVANLHLATEQNLTIIPVLNKIDLPAADVAKCKKQLEEILCIPAEDCIPASAKNGIGIEDILEAIIARIPAPQENPDKLLRCSVFDSLYDTYRGVVSYVRVFSGSVKRGQRVKLFATDNTYEVKEVGVFTPKMTTRAKLVAGDVGYVIANMKSASEVKIGDTMTDATHPCAGPLPGYKVIQPMVFSGVYPVDSSDYEALKMSMGKLQINDPAFTYQQESSACCTWKSSRNACAASSTWT